MHCPSSIHWRKITHLSSKWPYSLKLLHLFPLNDYIELSFKCQFKKAKIRCQVFNSDWDLARPAVVDDKSLMYSILVV